jgi:hypothetical protein
VSIITHLDCTSEDVAIVGQASREWRTVVEGEDRPALSELERCLEGIDLLPVFKHFLLFLGEVEWGTNWLKSALIAHISASNPLSCAGNDIAQIKVNHNLARNRVTCLLNTDSNKFFSTYFSRSTLL